MNQTNKTGFLSYAAVPLMIILFYVIASVGFFIAFKEKSTIFFFIIIASIFIVFMVLYALLPLKVKTILRIINIFLLSLLLFVMASILGRQNLQIEGFFFYILAGVFGGVIVHFIMGKIVGPIFMGRTWCSWGCWSLMIFDLLPYKKSRGWKKGSLKRIKYFHFIASLVLVVVLVYGVQYFIHDPDQLPDQPGTYRALYWFLIGNALYYFAGIILAVILKDNRAFCKYLCPVSLFLKLFNVVSLLRIKGDKEKCKQCNICVDNCLFNIKIPEYIKENTRVKCSECVMCMKCISVCPEGALKASIGFDIVTKDELKEY